MARKAGVPKAVPSTALAVMPTITVPGRASVETIFHGRPDIINAIKTTGKYSTSGGRTVQVQTRPIPDSEDLDIMALASVIRDPGRSDSYLDTIQDFRTSGKQRAAIVELYWRIYKNQGLINNAVNKSAAILSASGSFKVRGAKKGKVRKPVDELAQILYYWQKKVNSAALDAVVTGARGLKALNYQGVRYALVEGSWVGRAVWSSHVIDGLGTYDLPMTIQSISTAQIEAVKDTVGIGVELFDWIPPKALIQQVRKPADKDIKKIMENFIPKDIRKQLLSGTGRVRLDPALLMHVKNRGTDGDSFGESFIHPTMPALAYSESILQLDVVAMRNLINRLTIVMVGSGDKTSQYSAVEVVAARAALMEQLLNDPGPNMTVVWSGDDVKVQDIGAHGEMLDLTDRYQMGENRIKAAMGVPEALLSGTTTDGKAAGWAATIGASAQLEELANKYAEIWTSLGERIAVENGFTNVDLIYEWDRNPMVDRQEERTQIRNDYVAGGASIRRWLANQGIDPDAEYQQKCFEQGVVPGEVLWKDVFVPPQGLPGQVGSKDGRPTNNSQPGNTTPPAETKKPVEHK